jgi:hypothetical protein
MRALVLSCTREPLMPFHLARARKLLKRGKKVGRYQGKEVISSGSFNITMSKETIQGISYKFCKKLYSEDCYQYLRKRYQCYL